MPHPTTAQLIAAIERRKDERARATRPDDRKVLDEELTALRLALLKVRWMERSTHKSPQ